MYWLFSGYQKPFLPHSSSHQIFFHIVSIGCWAPFSSSLDAIRYSLGSGNLAQEIVEFENLVSGNFELSIIIGQLASTAFLQVRNGLISLNSYAPSYST